MTLPLAETGDLLFEHNGFAVREDQDFRWIETHGQIQAVMEMANHTRLVLPTHQTMTIPWELGLDIGKVINLGSGSGSFERWLSAHTVAPHLVSVESSKEMIEIARNYFILADSHQVENKSAVEYLSSSAQHFDVALIDLFFENRLADCLYDPDFYRLLDRRLVDNGLAVFNLITQDQSDMLKLLVLLRKNFPYVALAEIDNHSNVVLLAAKNEEFGLTFDTDRAGAALASGASSGHRASEIKNQFVMLPVA